MKYLKKKLMIIMDEMLVILDLRCYVKMLTMEVPKDEKEFDDRVTDEVSKEETDDNMDETPVILDLRCYVKMITKKGPKM